MKIYNGKIRIDNRLDLILYLIKEKGECLNMPHGNLIHKCLFCSSPQRNDVSKSCDITEVYLNAIKIYLKEYGTMADLVEFLI